MATRVSVFVKIEEASVPPRATVTTRGETTRLHPEIEDLQALRSAVQVWTEELTRTAVEDGKRVSSESFYGKALGQTITQLVIEDEAPPEEDLRAIDQLGMDTARPLGGGVHPTASLVLFFRAWGSPRHDAETAHALRGSSPGKRCIVSPSCCPRVFL